ncbi:MAG: hypothetical protein K1X57_15500, partial [Gemmataceae bacterium]|nr:hypothetical protein [Gemmataceae bacterium]
MSRFVLLCCLLLLAGCKPVPAPPPVGNPSAPGWEIRYNAALALAHRGAPAFADPATLEVMTELLDEKQQLSNFRLTRKDGSVVANPPAARMCLLGGLTA